MIILYRTDDIYINKLALTLYRYPLEDKHVQVAIYILEEETQALEVD